MRDKYFGAHEFQARTEVEKTSSDRSFGLVFTGFFTLAGALSLWKGTERWPIWFGLALVFLVVTLAAPRVLAPLNKAWAKFGLLIHHVVSPVMLGLMFYGCVVPMGFLMRLRGRDPLRLAKEPEAESYWITRVPPGPQPDTFRNQF
jgi:hypothetical protein